MDPGTELYWITLAATPPVEFEKLCAENPLHRDRRALCADIDAALQNLARLHGYLDARADACGNDQGHKKAVKASNRLCAKIRNALGYTYPNKDLSF